MSQEEDSWAKVLGAQARGPEFGYQVSMYKWVM